MASFNQPYPVQPGNYPIQQQQQQSQQQPQPMQTGMGLQQVSSNMQQSQTLGGMGQLPLSQQTQQPSQTAGGMSQLPLSQQTQQPSLIAGGMGQLPLSQQTQQPSQIAGGISQLPLSQQTQQNQQQTQMMSPTKEPNYALLCRAGQEYVHDIVNKTSEVFQTLKMTQLPHGLTHLAAMQTYKVQKGKTDELLQAINASFRKLRLFYDTVMEYTSSMTNPPIEDLLPFEGTELDERGKNTDMYRFVSEEHKEVYEQVRHKNQQIKEVIGQMRNLIWEINTMISMRKS